MPKLTKKKLEEYQKIKTQIDELKEREKDLRLEIFETVNTGKISGAMSDTFFGYKVTGTAKLNIKVDEEVFKSIFKKLTKEDKSCIKYKPSLIQKEYKNLPDNSILHKAIVSSPGLPSINIKPLEDNGN